jgi:hypothetical protein
VNDSGIAAIVSIKMAYMKEEAQCVFWFHETKSPLTVLRNFIRGYGRHPPHVRRNTGWYAKFKETGNVGERKRTGRPSVREEAVDAVQSEKINSSCLT